MRPLYIVAGMLLVAAVGYAAAYLFTIKGTVDVSQPELSPSPKTFSLDAASGSEVVKQITVRNTGNATSIYFSYVVEGPDPDSVDVSFFTPEGERITSTSRLSVPAGAPSSPSEVKVNVHVKVDDGAPQGSYSIFISARE